MDKKSVEEALKKAQFKEFIESLVAVSPSRVADIFSEDDLESFKEIELSIPDGMSHYWIALAAVLKAEKIDRYLHSKTVMIVDPPTHIYRIASIIGDYLEELLGSCCGFSIDDLAECSYTEIQEVLMVMQKIQTDKEYAYSGGSIPDNFYMLIKPVRTFLNVVDPGAKHRGDGGISEKYYNRLAKEIMGYDNFEIP